jgi:DNA invertase Pin-like site-specific DNA recombinase
VIPVDDRRPSSKGIEMTTGIEALAAQRIAERHAEAERERRARMAKRHEGRRPGRFGLPSLGWWRHRRPAADPA